MIEKLLPPPIEKPNPQYPRGSPMKLYDSDVVYKAMRTEEYLRGRKKVNERRNAKPKSKIDSKVLMQAKIYRDFLVSIPNDDLQNMEIQELEEMYNRLKNQRDN